MIDEIIPESIENELINHDEVVTWKDVIAFCKRRTYHLKQKTLARSSKGKVNALTPTSQTAADQPVPDDDDLTHLRGRRRLSLRCQLLRPLTLQLDLQEVIEGGPPTGRGRIPKGHVVAHVIPQGDRLFCD